VSPRRRDGRKDVARPNGGALGQRALPADPLDESRVIQDAPAWGSGRNKDTAAPSPGVRCFDAVHPLLGKKEFQAKRSRTGSPFEATVKGRLLGL